MHLWGVRRKVARQHHVPLPHVAMGHVLTSIQDPIMENSGTAVAIDILDSDLDYPNTALLLQTV